MKFLIKATVTLGAFLTVLGAAWNVQGADGVIRHHQHQPPVYPVYQSSWVALNGAWDSIEPKYEPNVQLSGRVIFNLWDDGSYQGTGRGDYQLISNCSFYDGTFLQTSTRTSVVADDSSVRVLQSVQSTTQQGGKYCSASIPVQIFQYQIENNVLILYTNTGKYYFQRAASY